MNKNVKTVALSAARRVLCLVLVLLLCSSFLLSVLADGENTGTWAQSQTIIVNTQADMTTALAGAQAGDSFIFVFNESMTLDNGVITVPAGVAVTFTNAENKTVTITRAQDMIPISPLVEVQGSLTIRESSGGSLAFDGGGYNFLRGTMLMVDGADSALTIEGGTYSNHHSNSGVISCTDGAQVTVNGGTFANNVNTGASDHGGVIKAENCSLTITGGSFSGNTAFSGGAVYYDGKVSINKLTITGGDFSANRATGMYGGAVYINYNDLAGDIPEDTKYTNAEITGGIFTGNSTAGFGGGIYIQDGAQVKINNVVAYQNTATQGGGVWNCGTGAGDYYAFRGLFLAENTAAGTGSAGDDFFSDQKLDGYQDRLVYLTDYAFTGDRVHWYQDEAGNRNSGEAAPDYYQGSNQMIALKSSLSTADVPTTGTRVVFTGNSAIGGGAIANNGKLQVGEETKLSVVKQTETETEQGFEFTIALTRDGAPLTGSFIYVGSDEPGVRKRIVFDERGTALFTLKAGETITVSDLPAGTQFEIKEINLPVEWKLESSVNANGTITSAQEATAVFINALNMPDLTSDPDTPQTGVQSELGLWTALLFVSGGGLLSFRVRKSKRQAESSEKR